MVEIVWGKIMHGRKVMMAVTKTRTGLGLGLEMDWRWSGDGLEQNWS